MAISFGVTVLPDPPYTRFLELLELAERRGFEYGWTYDSHVLWHESIPLLTLAAGRTARMKLGHFVTNPGTREPTVLASAYATMHVLSEGRMVMGIGRGDSARRVIGLQPVKVAEFERACRMIKDLMNGRAVQWNDRELKLEWARTEPQIPIYVAGYGPKALGVAGRVGEGLRRHRQLSRRGALVPGDGLEPRHRPDREVRLELGHPLGADRLRQGAQVLRLQGPLARRRQARRVRRRRDLRSLLRDRNRRAVHEEAARARGGRRRPVQHLPDDERAGRGAGGLRAGDHPAARRRRRLALRQDVVRGGELEPGRPGRPVRAARARRRGVRHRLIRAAAERGRGEHDERVGGGGVRGRRRRR